MKLVLVEWVDSHSGVGWQRISEIAGNSEPVRCRSVGWLVSDTKESKTLVPHISGDVDSGIIPYGCGDLTIPAASITSIKTIKGVNS